MSSDPSQEFFLFQLIDMAIAETGRLKDVPPDYQAQVAWHLENAKTLLQEILQHKKGVRNSEKY